jgi:hypothetical protein
VTSRDRVLVEILVPAPLGFALLFLSRPVELGRFLWSDPFAVLICLFLAYAFAIVPSGIYAWLIEWSLRRNWWRGSGWLGFVGFSTALGAAAGAAIWRASEAPVCWIGAIVGLMLGLLLRKSVAAPTGSPALPRDVLP